jgi:hypothetical protein
LKNRAAHSHLSIRRRSVSVFIQAERSSEEELREFDQQLTNVNSCSKTEPANDPCTHACLLILRSGAATRPR